MESLFITLNQLKHKPWLQKQAHSKIPNLCKDRSTENWKYSTNISPETTNGEDALEVAEIKAYFSLDSAVCIKKASPKMKRMEKAGREFTAL